MIERKTSVYTIPIGDKFLIYAPLKHMAFIGNEALAKAVGYHLENKKDNSYSKHELIVSLHKTGLFEPDIVKSSRCTDNQQFHPTLCILMPTTACNLSCTYCYAAYKGKKESALKWQVAKKAIDTAYNNSVTFSKRKFALSFHGGGEPTLPQDLFFTASLYAKSLDPDCSISVTTNAVWDKEFRERALNLLSEISISFDGNEATQNHQRPHKSGDGTFLRVMKTIDDIEKRKIPYGIRMTVTKTSLAKLRSNVEFLIDRTSCKSFQVEAVYDQGRAAGAGLKIDDVDAFTEAFLDVYHFARDKGRSVYYSSVRPHLITDTFCTATSDALIVTSAGELTACYEVFDRSHILSDDFITGYIDLKEGIVLYPGKREALLKKISDNRDRCQNCFCYYHCAGDCPPKAFMSHLSNDKFRCLVTQSITREILLDKIMESDGFWQGNIKTNQSSGYRSPKIKSITRNIQSI